MYIEAGPYLSFLLGAKQSVSGSLGTLDADNDEDFKSTDAGLGFGAGFNLGRWDFGVRYALGLTNISDVQGQDWYTRTLNFHVGFRIIEQSGE